MIRNFLFIQSILIISMTTYSQVNDTGDEVGIGVTNPEKKLDVLGPVRLRGDYSTLYFYRTTNPEDIAKIRYEEPNQKFIIGANNKDIIFSSKIDFGESMKISSNGDLSIYGSANINGSMNLTGDIIANAIETNSYLTVGGASRIKGDFATLYFQRTTNTTDIAKIRYEESNQTFIIGANNKDIIFSNKLNFSESMRITPQGKVGIGTTSPDAKLTVNGNIKAEKIEVTADIAAAGNISADNLTLYNSVPNSDHVFSSNYNLMDINEVAEYIMQHQHLPEVPSAEEFQENGYSVGEMDDLLLRKIEELTLYIIELKKVNEQQQTQIEELKSLVKQ